MLKPCSGTMLALAALAGAAIATPAIAQESAEPQDSPWAMHAPTPVPPGAPSLSPEQMAAEKGTPEQQELARKMVDAMYAKDYAALKQLVAPSTMKCIGQNQNYLDDRIRKQFELPISKNYHLTVIKLPPDLMQATKYATYPLPATHLLGMEFTSQDGSTVTVNEMIGQENGRWYETQPCPTQLGMQQFAQKKQMRARYRQRAKAEMARMTEPLKSQVLAYIAKRDNAAALTLCMRSLHVDMGTASGIVAILAGDEAD